MHILKENTSKRLHYVAYGANLDLVGMATRCPAAKPISGGVLHDYRLVFRGVADVEPEPGGRVPVAVWSITLDCLASLDRFEGYPSLYRREIVPVALHSGRTVQAIVYRMNEDGISPPSEGYLRVIERGYRHWQLPDMALHGAVSRARRYHLDRGALRFVPDGKKRMRPVYARNRRDCECVTPGMSPATRYEIRRECGCL